MPFLGVGQMALKPKVEKGVHVRLLERLSSECRQLYVGQLLVKIFVECVRREPFRHQHHQECGSV